MTLIELKYKSSPILFYVISFENRLGFEGLDWDAVPLGVKMSVFCVDGSQLNENLSLLMRSMQIAGDHMKIALLS